MENELDKINKEVAELKRQLHEKVVMKKKIRDKLYRPIRWKRLKANPIKYKKHLIKHRKESAIWRKKHPNYQREYRLKHKPLSKEGRKIRGIMNDWYEETGGHNE